MSWDVLIMNTRGKKPPPVDRIQPSDYEPLGPADAVPQRLSDIVPEIDWSDKTWGMYDGDGFSIQLNVGDEDPIETIMLHVHGGGDAISAIVTFAGPLGWSALDCSTGHFLDLDDPSQQGWEGFQEYRNRVLNQYADPPEGQFDLDTTQSCEVLIGLDCLIYVIVM